MTYDQFESIVLLAPPLAPLIQASELVTKKILRRLAQSAELSNNHLSLSIYMCRLPIHHSVYLFRYTIRENFDFAISPMSRSNHAVPYTTRVIDKFKSEGLVDNFDNFKFGTFNETVEQITLFAKPTDHSLKSLSPEKEKIKEQHLAIEEMLDSGNFENIDEEPAFCELVHNGVSIEDAYFLLKSLEDTEISQEEFDRIVRNVAAAKTLM